MHIQLIVLTLVGWSCTMTGGAMAFFALVDNDRGSRSSQMRVGLALLVVGVSSLTTLFLVPFLSWSGP